MADDLLDLAEVFGVVALAREACTAFRGDALCGRPASYEVLGHCAGCPKGTRNFGCGSCIERVRASGSVRCRACRRIGSLLIHPLGGVA